MIDISSGKAYKGSDVNRPCHYQRRVTWNYVSRSFYITTIFSVSVGYTQSSTTLPAPLTVASLPAPAAASLAAPSKSAAPSAAVRPVS